MDVLNLQRELLAFHNRVERLVALLRLLVALTRVSGFSLACTRLSDAAVKVMLLRAIEKSCSALPLRVALRILRLKAVVLAKSACIPLLAGILASCQLRIHPLAHADVDLARTFE